MKHLISLALKYIRRQKLRSALTFMCVALSAFILCSFGAYMGSIVQTLKNQEIRQSGSYEADITEWVDRSANKDEALKTIANHAAVSDYCTFYEEYFNYISANNKPEPDGRFSFMEFSDGKNTVRLRTLSYESVAGNADLCNHYQEKNAHFQYDTDLDVGDGYLVPEWIRDMGYSEGDTITFTLRNVNAAYDEDSEIIKEAREERLKSSGSSVFADDAGYNELEYEEKRKASRVSLASHLMNNKKIQYKDIPITDEVCGESFEYTLKISGFINAYSDNILLIRANNGVNPLFYNMTVHSDADSYGIQNTFVRINENLDIDDGLMMLFEDLGFSAGDYNLYQPVVNSYLLLLEYRLSSGIAPYIPSIALLLVVVLLIWLLARFVIDNAFEISAKERSTQYAALRVLGTSKGQIAALVFTEAVFYMLTAVPTGAALAYLICCSSVSALRDVGFVDFEFFLNPYIAVVSIFLCVLAIFISAYTSAMWAARKLSPAEALNFGKPKGNKKVRRHKSKLKLGSKRFFLRYIGKNIMRSKSRYFISTITMTIGVFLFTFVMIMGVCLSGVLKVVYGKENIAPDFTVNLYDIMCVEDIDSKFRGSDLFSRVEVNGAYLPKFGSEDSDEEFREYIKSISFYDSDDYQKIVNFVDVEYFNQNLAETLDMTYEEFSALDGVIFQQSIIGPTDENGEQSSQEERYVEFSESEIYTEKTNSNEELKIIGTMCSKKGNNGFIASVNSELAKKFAMDIWVHLNVNGSENYREAEKMYTEFIEKYNAEDSSANNYMFATGAREFVKAIAKMVLTLIGAIWAVGILSMVNSINTGVLNRSKELLMLRSVGMTRKQLKITIMLESVMFSALSSILGILLAVGSYVIFMHCLNEDIMFSGLVGAILLTALVNILIAAAASIPGIRNLEKAESLVKFAN